MAVNLLNQLDQNVNSSDPRHVTFIVGYATLFLIVISCNLIAMLAGYRRYKKCKNDIGHRNRTEPTRCILVIYLSLLGIVLGFTIPLIAVDLLTIDVLYANPNIDWMCRYTKFVPAMAIYATSMLVILIAVDSYRNICQPLKTQMTPSNSGFIFVIIILTAIIFASPLFISGQMIFIPVGNLHDNTNYPENPVYGKLITNITYIESDQINTSMSLDLSTTPLLSSGTQKMNQSHLISICVENWNFFDNTGSLLGDKKTGRLYYSIFSLIVQYLLPFLTISILHAMVFRELKKHGQRRSQVIIQIDNVESSHTENGRMKRNTAVLATMSLVFCFCWLPQNIIYIGLDGYHDAFGSHAGTTVTISVIIHWIGMASTWINPIIYGFLNTTIRQGM